MDTTVVAPHHLYFSRRLRGVLKRIATRPLTFVEAPMGYGKTSAVRAALRGGKTEIAWTPVTGPSVDNFWWEFCDKLAQTLPHEESAVESLRKLGYPYDTVLTRTAVSLVRGMRFKRKTVIVIDDCHLLEVPGLGELCETLARLSLPNLYIVLISRNAFGGNGESLRQKGLLCQVGKADLALTAEEISEYCAVCGLGVNRETSLRLQEFTGGWISALWLYLAAYREWDGLEKPIAMARLMEQELFNPLPEALRTLLLAVSPLERFPLDLASALSGWDTAWPLLHPLLLRNAFVSFDEATQTFTLHSMFRDFLKNRFELLPEQTQRAAHLKIGDWFAKRGEIVAAVEAYHAAKDFEKALTALEEDMGRGLVTTRASFFLHFFKECPPEILNRHLAAGFKYAIAAFTTSDFPTFARQCTILAAQLEQFPPDDKHGNTWRGELEFLRSLMAYNDIAAMSVHHRKANALLGRPTALFGEKSPWTLGSPSVLFMFHKERGGLADELRLMHECMPHYYTLAAWHGAGGEFMMEAESLYHAGRFPQAAILCHRAELFAAQHRQVSNILCALFLRMRLALATGKFDEARAIPSTMRDHIKDRCDFFLLYTIDLCEAVLHAALGQPDEAPAWISGNDGGQRLYAFASGYYFIVLGRILLLNGQHERLLGLLAHLLGQGQFKNHLLFAIYAGIYSAAAYTALGDHDEALRQLETALDMALPDCLYMPFVENSDRILPLLEQLAEHPDWKIRLQEPMTLCRKLPPPHTDADAPGPAVEGERIRLTPREEQLLHLSLGSKNYGEIAEELGLAASTVKRAYATIFKKLGLKNRLQLRAYAEQRRDR